MTKKVKAQQQPNKKPNIKPLPEPEIEPGTFQIQSGCVTCAPPSHLRVTIVAKLFNCFDAMGLNVNKQSRISGHTFSAHSFFCNIFKCTDNYIWQFLILMGVVFTA